MTGREIRHPPIKTDFDTLLDGLLTGGNIFFESGADAMVPNTYKYYENKSRKELPYLKINVKDNADITSGTGHPHVAMP